MGGNGWFYTGFAGVIALLSLGLVAVPYRLERAKQRKRDAKLGAGAEEKEIGD